ncbi:Pilin gene-inverting protein AltName: Full=PIVML [Fibrisoma limi BUZ 3]|uniref:Piv protein n=1 Tax=Fibrisoma limi BUZ 3 TaxID=1185876 RepID=I2GE76_9BACT|nr:IS110 family transposase [Fibrisoma limi]CCH52201.1 Pilin gene-inverting protein AltName: Full=PIVML [Fibrisoma limi BUZ 3]
MQQFDYFIGVDVSKATLDFAVAKANQILFHQQVTNDKRGITQFLKELRQLTKASLKQCLFCVEFTGIYNNPLLNVLHRQGAPIWVERAAHIQESMGLTRGKTDQVDAKRIALFAYKNRDEARLWTPPRAIIAQLDRLTAQRARLVKVIKMLQTPLTDTEGFVGKTERKADQQACAASLKSLKADLQSIDQAIAKLAQRDPELKRLFERVTSVVGISQTTAAEIIVATNEFTTISDPKKFACYAGVVPFERSSGQRRGKPQVSHMVNKKVKSLLHLGAMSAIQHCPQLKLYYKRKVAEGKNKMLVLNNVRNKMVHRIFACVRQDRNYDENFSHSFV